MCLRGTQSTPKSCKYDSRARKILVLVSFCSGFQTVWEGILVHRLSTPLAQKLQRPKQVAGATQTHKDTEVRQCRVSVLNNC